MCLDSRENLTMSKSKLGAVEKTSSTKDPANKNARYNALIALKSHCFYH